MDWLDFAILYCANDLTIFLKSLQLYDNALVIPIFEKVNIVVLPLKLTNRLRKAIKGASKGSSATVLRLYPLVKYEDRSQVEDACYKFLARKDITLNEAKASLIFQLIRSFGSGRFSGIVYQEEYKAWDPQYTNAFDQYLDHESVNLPKLRAQIERHAMSTLRPDPTVDVQNTVIEGLEVTIITPKIHLQSQQLPAIVYAHSGGWFVADYSETEASVMSRLAQRYRLNPGESVFPAGVDSLQRLTVYLRSIEGYRNFGVDPRQVSILGYSMGATYALIGMLRDSGLPRLRKICAVAPIINHRAVAGDLHRQQAPGPGLSSGKMLKYQKLYLPVDQPCNSKEANMNLLEISELSLMRLPRIYVAVMSLDIMQAEGKKFALLLNQAGHDVKVTTYWGMPHGLFVLGQTLQGQVLLRDVATFMKE